MPTTKKSVTAVKPKRLNKKRVVVSVKTIKKAKSTLHKKDVSLTVSFPVMTPKGEKAGSVALPKEMFGASFNAQLVAQAVRIYQMNQREGSAATKTRGMIEGSTRKIYRQKGTGRARHGGIRAPIFVGGGITFGPQPRDIHRTMPKQMKNKALACALSRAVESDSMKVVSGLQELPVKTKSFAEMLKKIQLDKRTLFIYGKETGFVVRAVRNIRNVTILPYDSFSVYDVMTHAYIVFTKDALTAFIAKGTKE